MGRVVEHGDLVSAADQSGNAAARVGDPVMDSAWASYPPISASSRSWACIVDRVVADIESGAGAVQVDAVLTPGSLVTQSLDIHDDKPCQHSGDAFRAG